MSNTYNYTDDDKKKIKKAVQEMNDSFTRVAAERDLQKSILEKVSEEVGMDKKLLRRLAKTFYNGSFVVEQTDFEAFDMAYNQIIGVLAD